MRGQRERTVVSSASGSDDTSRKTGCGRRLFERLEQRVLRLLHQASASSMTTTPAGPRTAGSWLDR
jgi:hypothetical protein